jgi:hypothetical protein
MQSQLIGWGENECLMLSQPTRGNNAVQLAKGVALIGRGLHEGEIWGFRSTVLFQAFQPFRILFLTYPEEIEQLSLRKSARIQTNLKVVLTVRKHEYEKVKDDPNTPRGVIRNISMDGCSISCPFRVEVDMPVFISGELPNGKVMENIMGFVRNAARDHDKNIYGVQFDSELSNLEELKEFIDLAAKIVPKTGLGSKKDG